MPSPGFELRKDSLIRNVCSSLTQESHVGQGVLVIRQTILV
ncbi:hypothetical protein CEXT_644831, partial [Caerostris extrusa]